MRKICFVITVVFLTSFCLSCDSDGSTNDTQYTKADYQYQLGTFAGLDEDAEWQIVQACLQKLKGSNKENNNITINDVWVDQYYGSYCPISLFPEQADDQLEFLRTEYLDPRNHTVIAVKVGVTSMDNGTEQRNAIINVPGSAWPIVIRYHDEGVIVLWDNGQLYDIEKDFDYNTRPLVAACDFRKIINRHNGLDGETDAMIREDIGKLILTGWTAEDYAWINIKYLGTYNGYTALTLYPDSGLPAAREQIIGDVPFYFPYKNIRVIVWEESAIYELEELYERGLVTREDLIEMAYFHNAERKVE